MTFLTSWLRKRHVVLTAFVAVLAFGLGSAYAAFAANSVTFSACLTPGGTLTKVSITGTASCSQPETVVSWNQVGPTGPAGPSGLSGYQRVVQDEGSLTLVPQNGGPGNSATVYQVNCPDGTKVLGGGVVESSPANFFNIQSSGPVADNSWAVVLVNDTNETATAGDVQAFATCATVAS